MNFLFDRNQPVHLTFDTMPSPPHLPGAPECHCEEGSRTNETDRRLAREIFSEETSAQASHSAARPGDPGRRLRSGSYTYPHADREGAGVDCRPRCHGSDRGRPGCYGRTDQARSRANHGPRADYSR